MLRREGIKPDIFDINRDMPTGPASPSLPPLDGVGVDSARYASGRFFSVHITHQIGPKLDHKDPSVMF